MSNLEMRPIDIDVFHNYSGNDSRQVPAIGAAVAVSKQGATVTQAVDCTSSMDVTVNVANSGRVVMGDVLSVNTSASVVMVKGVAADGHSLTVRNITPGGATISLHPGDRLCCLAGTGVVVASAITIPAHTIADDIALRGPQGGDTIFPTGLPVLVLTVQSVAADGLSVVLHNSTGEDILLAAGTPMLRGSALPVLTVTSETTCANGGNTTVPMRVFIPLNGQVLYSGTNLDASLLVAGFDDSTGYLTLNNTSSSPISLSAGAWLQPRTAAEVQYADASGAIALGAAPLVLDARGHARFHTPEARVDCIVTGGGLPAPLLLPDRLGGWARGALGIINARDFPSIQDAIDALPPAGGTVYVPAGTYEMTDTLYTPCDRPCHLVGEGTTDILGGIEMLQGSVLLWSGNTDMLRVRGDRSSVRNLTLKNTSISGTPSRQDQGRGLTIARRAVADPHPAPGTIAGNTEHQQAGLKPIHRVVVEDVTIINSAGWGIHVPGYNASNPDVPEYDYQVPVGSDGGTMAFWIELRRVVVKSARNFGAYYVGGGCTTVFAESCAFLGQGATEVGALGNRYAYVSGSQLVTFERCTFEGYSPSTNPWVTVWGAENTQFSSCWFEENASDTPHDITYFIHLKNDSRGGTIQNGHFQRDAGCGGYLKLIQVDSGGSAPGAHGLVIVNPYALSADISTTNTGSTANVYVDSAHVDLGDELCTATAAIGTGVYYDQSRGSLAQDSVVAVQYGGTSGESCLTGGLANKVRESNAVPLDPVSGKNGNLLLDHSVPGAGALAYFAGGVGGAWRLTNNAPTLSTAEREARSGWVQGDIIYNSVLHVLQAYVGTTWKTITLT